MSKRNVRIAIRDTTDSHNVGFFDNKSGIKYNSANLTQFLKGACSVLVLTYHSKKMIAQSGQKLAFRFKDKDFWLNINSVKKTGYKIELTAYSLSLEANKEKRGPHKPANAMTIKQYIDYYDPEHSFEIGINEVADKSIKLEWSGTDTILARLYSVANSFGAELEFVTELNDDYSLKRHVVNIYREGNLGKDKTGMPVRVGEKLKVINYSDNMDDFYTGIRRTGKDGLTIAGLNKKIYDDKGNLLFYSSGDTLYAPQARDKYPSIARKTNDGYIVNEDSETEHENKEALFGYMLSELKKHCELKVDYEVEGAVDGSIGDRKTLIDARHFDPPLYVQARISEQTEALLETSNVKTTLSNYVRKSSQIANELLQRVEQLALEAAPYTIKLATNNGIVFKNNQGQSTIYPSLKRGQKPVECTWKWLVDNQGFGTSPTFEVQAAGMSSKLVLTAIALIDGKEVAREQVTFTNVNDGKNGSDGKSITVTKAEKQADGVKVTFSDNKSIVVPKGDKGAIDEEKLKEIEQNINSKADNALTQEQLNALNEKNAIMQAEWEAKASLGTLNKAIAEYKSYTLQNNKDKAKSEKDLISLNQRLVENIRNLKELAERWNFLDKYFQVGNEGIVFGEQNGNTCAKMSNDRFSIFSAGTEVMYISQGTLFIENGIFSKSIQIGRFREEQYHLNLDMNVIRYVGGI
ncbi:phage tail protein [Streptococcus vaginalis]|uniref:Phage tail protein n=2 Tax=Lactobacillales TaxID=186826 RepID=A0ABS3GEN7_9STRE|nr:phage tail protein [Streptococcus vaginalis]MBO0365127.1 phage tail protein [Streptococcus vaginalis]MED5823046.1 phage tail protein [Streptococcus anginosus]MED5856739.1 phage tail protein [Streptococcus anginosus]